MAALIMLPLNKLFSWLSSSRHERAQHEHRLLLQGNFAASVAVGDVGTALEQIAEIGSLAKAANWPSYEVQNVLACGRFGEGKDSRQVLRVLLDPATDGSLSQHGKRALLGAMLNAGVDLHAYDNWIGPNPYAPYIHLRGDSLLHGLARNYPQDPTGAFEPLETHLRHEIATLGPAAAMDQVGRYKATMFFGYDAEIERGYNGTVFHAIAPQHRQRMDDFLQSKGIELHLAEMKFPELRTAFKDRKPETMTL